MAATIIGQGLAGSCLAWQLHFRGADFSIYGDHRSGASSRVAAGLVNPVTGKNYNPGWRYREFLAEAEAFYSRVGEILDQRFWFPMPVVRLVEEEEWEKLSSKLDALAPWIERVENTPGWRAALTLRGGGRVAVREFCDATEDFMRASGRWRKPAADDLPIHCEGAAGLIAGQLGPHRCAKGEILTLRAGWPQDHIRVGAGGWLVPIGDGLFKCGSTYDWDRLDGEPTPEGRTRVTKVASRLGGDTFQIVAHEAGIRPIVRRSQPLIGPLPDGSVIFNGLGSKGSLYAPGVAARLADWLGGAGEIDPELDVRRFR